MRLADLSIERPTFITCIVLLMLSVGLISMNRIGVDLFPNVTFPVVVVNTTYPGAGPAEVETLVSKPLEDEISTISGIKRLSSTNAEGLSTVVAEFTLATDVKYAEQQIRDRVGSARKSLPDDIKEPVIRRVDPADQPILELSITADLSPAKLYDLANEVIRPRLEQVADVGLVEIVGGRKREIHVELDRNKLRAREISAGQVAGRLAASGEDIPVGKIDESSKSTVYRTVGQFEKIGDISSTIVNFMGNDIPVTIADVGRVTDSLEDETTRTFIAGKPSVLLNVYKQTGTNTIAVVTALQKRIGLVNDELKLKEGKGTLTIIRDGAMWINANVDDVKESILIGVSLAVIVVFFFLGNVRSTIITGLALPNSLIGAFILMAFAGFTVNIMTLLALSLSVGLLIDDAIVVRENIFRHMEMGKKPIDAAREGTSEVRMAVIATTLAVIAVFGPVGFIPGVIGQFLKEFGFTVCFAMLISLFDALTIAPMLSAYFAGKVGTHGHHTNSNRGPVGKVLGAFDRFQTRLENVYTRFITYTLAHPGKVIAGSIVTFIVAMSSMAFVPGTFLPPQDAGEFAVGLDMAPGTSLEKMTEVALKVDQKIRAHKEVRTTRLKVGSTAGESNIANFYVAMVPSKERKINTIAFKESLRGDLKEFADANPIVMDYDPIGAGQRPFNLNILGTDMKVLQEYTTKLAAYMKKSSALKDVDTNFRSGKPEFQIVPDKKRMEALGISTAGLGSELRAQVEGVTPAKFREGGIEYDIRVRLQEDQRNLQKDFAKTYVPNVNQKLIRAMDVAKPLETAGPTKIYRQDRARYIQINADMAPNGNLNALMLDLKQKFVSDPELKLPLGSTYAFVGQVENFQEMQSGMNTAMGLGVLFIFFVLASLYESFVTPFTIMLALPLGLCGAFVALLVAHESLNIFSMIGVIMLLGIASKNSILLVDFANHLVQQGKTRSEAMLEAGRTRLRPILMTTMALIAGTIPIAIGLNEASKQRTSMGVAIIGGLVSSTLLTLIVVPAAYSFIDRFRVWSLRMAKRIVGNDDEAPKASERPAPATKAGAEAPIRTDKSVPVGH